MTDTLTTYSTLYGRSSTGATLVWWMEQEGNKYRTNSGIKDGQIVTSDWTVAKPKNTGKANATTGEEQATAEVLSKYKKKRKEQYKDSIDDIDDKQFIEPMTAKKYKDYKDKIDFFNGEWIYQIKYNGARCVASQKGLYTRTGEEYQSVPHIWIDLQAFFQDYPEAVLDGELYNYDLRQSLNELMKLINKKVHITVDDYYASAEKVRYYVYDGYRNEADKVTPYIIRKAWIDETLPKYTKMYRAVPDYEIGSEVELSSLFNSVVNDGQEGLMGRLKHAPYEHKRSKNLLKIKAEDSSECKILKINDGDGNWANKCKTFTIEWNGKVFDASLKGGKDDAIEIWNNQADWVGKENVTFLYNGLTGLGVPNFARIDCRNCFKR